MVKRGRVTIVSLYFEVLGCLLGASMILGEGLTFFAFNIVFDPPRQHEIGSSQKA